MLHVKKKALIIGCDQTLSLHDKLLHKPANKNIAYQQIKRLAGGAHFLHSAFCLVIVDEYGSTDAAKTAGYFIGRINYDREDYNLAQPYFESYISGGSNVLLIGAASQALVYILLNKGNVEEAIRYQKQAIDKANSKVDAGFASIQLAELYINKGKTNEAETILKNLLVDYEDHFQVRKKIDEVFGMLQAEK